MKILKIREQKDGSALLDFELSKKDEKILRDFAKQKQQRYSKKFIRLIILEAIGNTIKNATILRNSKHS